MGFRRDDRGFSLVEMMVVIGVLGLVIGIAVPGIRGSMERARVDQVSTELQSDLRLALSTAKATGRTVRIRFDDRGYRLFDAADTTRVFQSREFPGTLRLQASGDPLVFPWGLVQPADLDVHHRGGSASFVILPTGRIEYPDANG